MPLRIFPVSGGASYVEDFAYQKPDGRSHQGNDLMAPEGRPLLAVDDGLVKFGTDVLGGNVANGSPIGDSMPALIVLGASVVLQGADGARSLPLEDFYLDYRKKDLRPGEFVATSQGQALIVLGHVGKLHARVDIDQNDIGRVQARSGGGGEPRGHPGRQYPPTGRGGPPPHAPDDDPTARGPRPVGAAPA